jgi:hypothetical protein
MATQRIAVAKIAGAGAAAVANRFRAWWAAREGASFPPAVRAEVDQFALALRAHSAAPPVVYFCEWIDHWSMGDAVPGLGIAGAVVVQGDRFEACCHRLPATVHAPTFRAQLTQESERLAARVREAGLAWADLAPEAVLIVLREVVGGTVTDDEVLASLGAVPPWLGTE